MAEATADKHILIVDDERTTRRALREAFLQKGYQADAVGSAQEAIQALKTHLYDVAILDLQMPGMSGVHVLTKAEEITPHTAIIILTAHASADTAITALRSGAYDYLRKPISLEALFTAVETALHKQAEKLRKQKALALLQEAMFTLAPPESTPPTERAAPDQMLLTVGDITINEKQQSATYQNQPLELTPMEYKLLLAFARHPDTVLSYTELVDMTHNMEMEENEARATLRTHIFRLRQKLGQEEECPIQSVRGRGVILQSYLAKPSSGS
ncbi:MAG TPA: response regulator transcription factor [Chloroflexota bacterium]|nr:response regulator transcription factor [Chloroflexota bacterium]HUM67843.1 response regulator transcription factor [Chloroflexota bacterium]